MKTRLSTVVPGALLGMALGVGSFMRLHDHRGGSGTKSELSLDSRHGPRDGRPGSRELGIVLTGPRPSIDEVLQATGHEAIERLVRFLREASMDEVITLLEAKGRGSFSWLIYQRGLALDSDRLVSWTEQQPASRSRDLAAVELVQAAQSHFSAQTLSLAQGISDADQRRELIQESLSNLARHDPDQATKFLEKSTLPSDALAQVEAEIAQARAFRDLVVADPAP